MECAGACRPKRLWDKVRDLLRDAAKEATGDVAAEVVGAAACTEPGAPLQMDKVPLAATGEVAAAPSEMVAVSEFRRFKGAEQWRVRRARL